MKMIKTYASIGISLAVLIMLASSAYAFAISCPYWNDNALKLSPGEKTDFKIVLNNGGGAINDMNVKCAISEGADIATITDSSSVYLVSAGGTAEVNLEVSVAADVSVGGSRNIKISCSPVPLTGDNTSKTMGIASSIDQNIPVFIVEKEKPGAANKTLYLLIGLVIIAAVAIFFALRKKKKR